MANLTKLDLHGLIVVGGDGTMSFAQKFIENGATRIVGVPKTIDHDLEATDYTVGFQTAVEIVVEAVERLHTTAESHERIMIVEVMGRYAGWIALTAGLAGRRARGPHPRDRAWVCLNVCVLLRRRTPKDMRGASNQHNTPHSAPRPCKTLAPSAATHCYPARGEKTMLAFN